MLNPVEFIQKNVLRDVSPILTPILTALMADIQLEIWDFHNWRISIRRHTLGLTQNINRYTVSGADNDCAMLLSMRYGADLDKMQPCGDMDYFYDTYYKKVGTSNPYVWVPESKLGEARWEVFIYPVEISDPENITYWYKRLMVSSDFVLFSNPMVLVDGILWRFFSNEKRYEQAQNYMNSYLIGRDKMKDNDGVMVYPDKKITSSQDTKEFRDTMKTYRTQRRRY